jgi:hypothetical protein
VEKYFFYLGYDKNVYTTTLMIAKLTAILLSAYYVPDSLVIILVLPTRA